MTSTKVTKHFQTPSKSSKVLSASWKNQVLSVTLYEAVRFLVLLEEKLHLKPAMIRMAGDPDQKRPRCYNSCLVYLHAHASATCVQKVVWIGNDWDHLPCTLHFGQEVNCLQTLFACCNRLRLKQIWLQHWKRQRSDSSSTLSFLRTCLLACGSTLKSHPKAQGFKRFKRLKRFV